MNIKNKFRKYIRRILSVKSKETISDAIYRHKLNFFKTINRRTFTLEDLKVALTNMDIKKGDILYVHSCWRSFIGFNISPQDFIKLLLEVVGDEGTILMPCYGYKDEIFDINNTPSHAGIVTEIFRNMEGVIRSNNAHFSICAKGREAENLTKDHFESKYAFDEKSPYYKGIVKNSKVMMIGLGKKPHKHSVFHCATYSLRKEVNYYERVFNNKRIIQYIYKDQILSREIVDRIEQCRNHKGKMKKAFKLLPTQYKSIKKIGFLDIIVYDTKPAYEVIIDMAQKGEFIYKIRENRLKRKGIKNNA